MVPEELRYTKEHEWIRIEGDVATVGITDHAQSKLGDVVYCELPEAGAEFKKGETFGAVESVKAASDCYMPLSGSIVESNGALEDAPESVNKDPYGGGWMIKIKILAPAEADELLTAAAYGDVIKEEG
jgi:glycine cleavage system H protein